MKNLEFVYKDKKNYLVSMKKQLVKCNKKTVKFSSMETKNVEKKQHLSVEIVHFF